MGRYKRNILQSTEKTMETTSVFMRIGENVCKSHTKSNRLKYTSPCRAMEPGHKQYYFNGSLMVHKNSILVSIAKLSAHFSS